MSTVVLDDTLNPLWGCTRRPDGSWPEKEYGSGDAMTTMVAPPTDLVAATHPGDGVYILRARTQSVRVREACCPGNAKETAIVGDGLFSFVSGIGGRAQNFSEILLQYYLDPQST